MERRVGADDDKEDELEETIEEGTTSYRSPKAGKVRMEVKGRFPADVGTKVAAAKSIVESVNIIPVDNAVDRYPPDVLLLTESLNDCGTYFSPALPMVTCPPCGTGGCWTGLMKIETVAEGVKSLVTG